MELALSRSEPVDLQFATGFASRRCMSRTFRFGGWPSFIRISAGDEEERYSAILREIHSRCC